MQASLRLLTPRSIAWIAQGLRSLHLVMQLNHGVGKLLNAATARARPRSTEQAQQSRAGARVRGLHPIPIACGHRSIDDRPIGRWREELSNGDLDCRRARDRARDGALASVRYLLHSLGEGARTHLVHLVEAAGPLGHRQGHWWTATHSAWRRRCEGGTLLSERYFCGTYHRRPHTGDRIRRHHAWTA